MMTTEEPERWPGYRDLSWEERFHTVDALRQEMVQDIGRLLGRIEELESAVKEVRLIWPEGQPEKAVFCHSWLSAQWALLGPMGWKASLSGRRMRQSYQVDDGYPRLIALHLERIIVTRNATVSHWADVNSPGDIRKGAGHG